MPRIKYTRAIIEFFPKGKISAEQVRGFFGYVMLDDSGFHHHSDRLIYEYPKVQYKVLDNKIYVIGLEDYAEKIYAAVTKTRKLIIANKEFLIRNINFETTNFEIRESDAKYKFITPWIALNNKNYFLFRNLHTTEERKQMLNKILAGNILSFLKGLNIFIDFRLIPQVDYFKVIKVVVNKNAFVGVYTKFGINILMPDYIGIGKSVSKGYGTIVRY